MSRGAEEIVVVHDERSGLHAALVIDDTRLGPARGGTRWREISPYQGLREALDLARDMTRKLALYERPFGGGKAVIFSDDDASPAVRARRLEAFCRTLRRFQDRFRTGPDAGLSAQDHAILAAGAPDAVVPPETAALMAQASARGVAGAISACLEAPLERASISILGLGTIGARLAALLHERGATLRLADPLPHRARELAERLGAEAMSPSELLRAPADVLAPCAPGGFTEDELAAIRAPIICGAGNAQLPNDEAADALAQQGRLHIPGFVANAGAALIGTDWSPSGARLEPARLLDAAEAHIAAMTARLLAESRQAQEAPLRAALRHIAARFASAGHGRT